MKVLLVENSVFVKDIYGALLKKEVEVPIDTSYIKEAHLYKFSYCFNNDNKYIEAKDNKIILPDFKDNKDCVIIKVRATNLSTKNVVEFKSDPINISNYYYLGDPIEHVHPNVLAGILKRVEVLEKRILDLEGEGDLI
jgi:hypothetical protein